MKITPDTKLKDLMKYCEKKSIHLNMRVHEDGEISLTTRFEVLRTKQGEPYLNRKNKTDYYEV